MKKSILLTLVTLLMAGSWLGVWPNPVKAAPYVFTGGGNGTALDPYIVLTAEDMNHVRDGLGGHYRQGADIDLSDYAAGTGWEPIGTDLTPFTGSFDGNHYTLTGMVTRSSARYVGLFGYTQGAALKNMNLDHVNVTGEGAYDTGSLAGFALSTAITGIYVSGTVAGNNNPVTSRSTGGLVGVLGLSPSQIRNSYSTVNVSGYTSVGGLVGTIDLGTNGIESSYASGNVHGETNIGGLAGLSYGPIRDSYMLGNIQVNSVVSSGGGGLTAMLQNSLQRSFAAGTISGPKVGALLSEHRPAHGAITNAVWNTTANPTSPGVHTGGIGGSVGLTEAQMKTSAAYTGFDFSTIWGINEGNSYPYLRVFTPVVRIDAWMQTKYRHNSVLLVNGTMRDGSVGEAVYVDYKIVNRSSQVVASGSQNFSAATGSNQNYSFPVTLDSTRFPEGTYTVNVMAGDAWGNQAVVRSVTFMVDSTPPAITLNGTNTLQLGVGSIFTDPGATALDAVDGDLTSQVTVNGTVNTNQVGTYALTYQVTDAAGNTATKTRTVNVVDGVAPIITLIGSNPMQVEAGSIFTDPGATAWDAVDGDLTSQVTVSGTVNTNQVGTYTLTYQVSDAAGNPASLTRVVNVADNGAPVITLMGPNPIQVEAGNTFTDPGAIAMDAVDGDLTDRITVSGTINTNQVGTYTLSYNVTDRGGNHAPDAVRSVQVKDTVPPVITLLGDASLTLRQGTAFLDPGATATDSFDGDLTGQITVTGSVYSEIAGAYSLVYKVQDSSGNAAAELVRTVNVLRSQSSSSSGGSSSATSSSLADLARLNVYISGKEIGLSPAFTPGTTEYTAETDAGQVELQLGPANFNAIMKLAGEPLGESKTIPLAIGTNVLAISVQAEDGTLKTYTVTIHRIAGSEQPSASAPVCAFTDIRNHWAKTDICEAAGLGIVEGVDAQTFMPDKYVTRTEFAVMLLRTLQVDIRNESGAMTFSDKDSIPEWARWAIQTAVVEGVLNGYSDGTLKPMQTLNRTEMAAMVAKAMKWEAVPKESPFFSDDVSIPAWAKGYVEATRKQGLLEGRQDNQFVPDGRTTRAEAAVVFLRLYKTLH
ncbi:immunoglobulin-like domain-containing protein [Paenibacillus radicis (ex Xue et al. 2023)]|uniref:DUF5011 domain-containing protein n=1 Tax=Paenibacillus radicis (ex Xue et al. 2023) TaxID=2972489 RepID=A0ABT1YG78_9BACL|nr:immunoglobulin-like domain-containing protein [Paenibacillus radicis (ex Xue et al. 2023)]MCR8632198.1 DUF5011 domain-containing protein [Paenibacillus radicis (ex Xue et al. 2023)]